MTSLRSFLERPAVRIVLVAGTTAGAVSLFLALARPGRLVASLGSLPLTSVLAAAGATMAGVMLGAVRWCSLLSAGGVQAPAPRLFAALTIGSAVNNLVPARGGDAVRVESAHQLTGAPRLAVAGTMLSERILDGFVLALRIVAGAALEGVGGAFLWVGASLAGGIAVAAVVLGRFGERVLRGRLSGFERGLAVFRATRVVAPALGLTAGIWLADVVMYGALARGFHLDRRLRARRPQPPPDFSQVAVVPERLPPGWKPGGGTAVIVLPPMLTGAMLVRVALPKAFRLRREPGGVAA